MANDWESMSQEDQARTAYGNTHPHGCSADDRPIIQIKTERRYGRIVQRADGSVLHIETREQVVQYRQAPVEGSGFGMGFEQRVAETEVSSEGDAVTVDEPATLRPAAPAEAPETLPVIRTGDGTP
jgi:hypothetical protein